VNNRPEAISWLGERDLQIFLHLAGRIRFYRDSQTWDYHKKPF